MNQREKRKNLILLIILTVQTISAMDLDGILINTQDDPQLEKELWLRLLQQIDKQQRFEWVLIVGHNEWNFMQELLEIQLHKSVLINENYTCNYNLDFMQYNFLTLAFMPDTDIPEFISIMAEKLDLRRNNRLIIINNNKNVDTFEDSQVIADALEMCAMYKLLNVIMILQDFLLTHLLYSFRAFPEFVLETRLFNETSDSLLFPSKVKNMYGHMLRTIPDQVMPRSVVYIDAEGKVRVTGYITQFLRMFAKYINSTLQFADDLRPGQTLFYRDFANWTQMDLLDIPCSITPVMNDNSSRLMSYTYELLSWCLMLPVEQPLTYQDFLKGFLTLTTVFFIFLMDVIFTALLTLSMRVINLKENHTSSWNFVDVMINPQVILGHLGSSFQLHGNPIVSLRIIYMSLFVSGLLYTTAFSVQLNAFLTRPNVQEITSLDDMLKRKVSILTAKDEFKSLMKISGTYFLPYLSLFKIVDSYKEFADVRTSLNSSYAYPVTSSVWHVYAVRQKLFARQLFRRTQICFTHLDLMSFALPRNSLHKQNLDTLITRVRDMGLVRYWLENSFYDMVKIGRMSFKDISHTAEPASYIRMTDFRYVVVNLFKAFSFSLLVFVLEICWYYRCCKTKNKVK